MNNLKMLDKTDDQLRVGNYIVLFGGKDLAGEHFTSKTMLESAYTKSGVLHVDFEHGRDPDKMGIDQDDILGFVAWKTAKIDDVGVFVERVLNRRAKYMEVIEPLIEQGLIGTSSQAVTGKTARTKDGEILEWPLMRDSLTFTPAEPRMLMGNTLQLARTLRSYFPESKSLALLDEVAPLKEAIDSCKSLKELEALLRGAVGLSRADATALVSKAKNFSRGEHEQMQTFAEIAKSLNEFKLKLI